ncbi:unnamed protein product [Musa banksii]
MNPGETTPPSPLDKPLAELTEEDIAQLTREDCRRFLKAKGQSPLFLSAIALSTMLLIWRWGINGGLDGNLQACDGRRGTSRRRSSRSSLSRPFSRGGPAVTTALLAAESSKSCSLLLLRSRYRHRRSSAFPSLPMSSTCVVVPFLLTSISCFFLQDSPPPAPKEGGSGSQPLAKEPSPYRRRDPIPPPYSAGNPTCQTPIAGADLPHPPEKRCPSPRLTAEVPVGQMTIFYDGMVNVYDGVSADQARSIMELAASPVCFDDPTGAFSPARPPAFRFPPGLPRPAPVPTAPSFVGTFPISPAGTMIHRVADGSDDRRVPRETEPEGPTSRKASLQRYLEKRKDRFKGKKIIGGPTSSNMEMICFNQKLSCPNQNELPNPCDTSFPTLIQQPQSPAKCSPAENETQREKIFFDLNDDG